jgi:hypothetical protein
MNEALVSNLLLYVFTVIIICLSGCAHRAVTLDELNRARTNVTMMVPTTFEWYWQSETDESAIENQFIDWMEQMSVTDVDVCVCIPAIESQAQSLIQGWAHFRRFERLAKTMNVSLHVNVALDNAESRLVFMKKVGAPIYGQ